jgi:hypothetical protein
MWSGVCNVLLFNLDMRLCWFVVLLDIPRMSVLRVVDCNRLWIVIVHVLRA